MDNSNRLQPFAAAQQYIYRNFSHCNGALLAGSVVRGNATPTSDLDIVVFDKSLPTSFRESVLFMGWPIEVFAHNLYSYKQIFQSDYERARPTHQQMVVEGRVIVDHGIISTIKQEAAQMLELGPEPWTRETIQRKRYFITDALDDFIGSSDRAEGIFIANTLADWLHEFVLRTNRQWIGDSKWIVRSLKKFDPTFSNEFISALESFYQHGEKQRVIAVTDKVLAPHGGRLFHGFSIGK